MKITLKILQDDHNSYPSGGVEFECVGHTISIKVSDDRRVFVSRNEFVKLLRLMGSS